MHENEKKKKDLTKTVTLSKDVSVSKGLQKIIHVVKILVFRCLGIF